MWGTEVVVEIQPQRIKLSILRGHGKYFRFVVRYSTQSIRHCEQVHTLLTR